MVLSPYFSKYSLVRRPVIELNNFKNFELKATKIAYDASISQAETLKNL